MEINNPNHNHPPNATMAFGATLSKARKSKQISIEDAAAELFILKRHLQALEEEDFEALPQAAFARGFAINYAKFLGVDPHQVAASFDAVYPEQLKAQSQHDVQSPLQPMGTLHRDSRNKIRFNPLLVLAVIAVVVLAVFLLRTITGATEDGQSAELNQDDISLLDQEQGASLSHTTVSGSGVAFTPSTANTGTSAGTNSVAFSNSDSTVNASTATLDFWVKANTNITVEDATGNNLMTGQQLRGGYQLRGQPPFKISIDKVNNVSLNLNQQPIAIKQYANNNQASFSVAP